MEIFVDETMRSSKYVGNSTSRSFEDLDRKSPPPSKEALDQPTQSSCAVPRDAPGIPPGNGTAVAYLVPLCSLVCVPLCSLVCVPLDTLIRRTFLVQCSRINRDTRGPFSAISRANFENQFEDRNDKLTHLLSKA